MRGKQLHFFFLEIIIIIIILIKNRPKNKWEQYNEKVWNGRHISLTCSYICIIFKSIKGFDWHRRRIRIQFTKKLTPVMQHIKKIFFTMFSKKKKRWNLNIQSKPKPTSLKPFQWAQLHFLLWKHRQRFLWRANILYLYSFTLLTSSSHASHIKIKLDYLPT